MAPRQLAGLEAAFHDQRRLLRIERLAQVLIDRGLRQLPSIAGAGGVRARTRMISGREIGSSASGRRRSMSWPCSATTRSTKRLP